MKYGFFFFLQYNMLSEDPPILLLYLIILHSINSTKCTKYIYITDFAKVYGEHYFEISISIPFLDHINPLYKKIKIYIKNFI